MEKYWKVSLSLSLSQILFFRPWVDYYPKHYNKVWRLMKGGIASAVGIAAGIPWTCGSRRISPLALSLSLSPLSNTTFFGLGRSSTLG